MRFGLIGAAGFVAPRHMRAIKEVGGELVAALDPRDSVGIIDSFFPDARFFTEFERFDRHVDKIGRDGMGPDYISVCSPNYLHDAHCRFALRSGADAICEKPLVLNPWNIDGLAEMEATTGRRIHTILQLRLHPAIQALKAKVETRSDHLWMVDLSYVASRGRWYQVSWKGETQKSGGVATNIGVHFFDMLVFVFGTPMTNRVHLHHASRAAGTLEFGNAKVRWFLSVDRSDLPVRAAAGQATFRSITLDDEEIEFSSGFTDLHTESYRQILAGNGFSLIEARPAIEIVSAIREMPLSLTNDTPHPMALPYL